MNAEGFVGNTNVLLENVQDSLRNLPIFFFLALQLFLTLIGILGLSLKCKKANDKVY